MGLEAARVNVNCEEAREASTPTRRRARSSERKLSSKSKTYRPSTYLHSLFSRSSEQTELTTLAVKPFLLFIRRQHLYSQAHSLNIFFDYLDSRSLIIYSLIFVVL